MQQNINAPQPPRVLSVLSLVMINVIAVDSLRTLPFSAKFGSALVYFYCICALLFFFPIALVTAELATTWPKTGGIYHWVKQALGSKFGFLVVWLQWVYNVVWFPTVLGLIAGVGAYLIEPQWADNPVYMTVVVLVVFWFCTLINFFGMKISSWVSGIGSILGTLLPMGMMIALGIYWVATDHPLHIQLTKEAMIPRIDEMHELVLITTILFGLMGLEMSAVHAQEVRDPSKDYPRALKISSAVILLTLIFSSLTVAMVVPGDELNVVTGLVQAFKEFFEELQMLWMLPLMCLAIILGAMGGVATWIIGPSKGLLAAAQDGRLPAWLAKTNRYGVPTSILWTQAVVVTLLSLAYVFLPSVETAYLYLTELTAILGLLMYLLMFISAIVLRYKQPDIHRPYRIPVGNLGMWLVCIVGALTCVGAMMLGLIPPAQIKVDNPAMYQSLLLVGVLGFCLPALFIHRRPSRESME